ncbi:MAG: NAD-dependent epimerase/dehydratase family protein [Myxococcota bacterium]|nr:NAD-dependent epimerase/dehydratase family protein [Myxococcota bacterium]
MASTPKRRGQKRKPRTAPKRRVALTGARTYMGERLVASLEADERCEHILICDSAPPANVGPKTRFAQLDLTRPDADGYMAGLLEEERIDTLCHLAFLAFPSHASSWAHEVEAIGSLYVMNAAAAAKVRKVVMSSTTMVYGAHSHNPNYLTEEEPLRGTPSSRWVNDKVSAERELMRLKMDAPEIITTSLRFGIVVGPSVRGFFPRVLDRDVIVRFMGYDPLMQFVHEDDAQQALLKAVWEDHQGPFNVVGDGVVYLSDVARIGGKVPLTVPHTLAQPLTTLLWGLQVVDIPGAFLDFFRYSWCGDNRRMRNVMGFEPRYSSREALIEFFGSHGVAIRQQAQGASDG